MKACEEEARGAKEILKLIEVQSREMGKWGRGKGGRMHQRSQRGEWLGGWLGIFIGGEQMFKELTIKEKVNLK